MFRGEKVIGGGVGAHLWWPKMETAGGVREIAMRGAFLFMKDLIGHLLV